MNLYYAKVLDKFQIIIFLVLSYDKIGVKDTIKQALKKGFIRNWGILAKQIAVDKDFDIYCDLVLKDISPSTIASKSYIWLKSGIILKEFSVKLDWR